MFAMRYLQDWKSKRFLKPAFVLSPILCLGGCASQPQPPETVWMTVVEQYSAEGLAQAYNESVRQRFRSAGFSAPDVEQGRLLRVACGLGTDHTWGSYAYLPSGMKAKKHDVLRLRVKETGTNEQMPLNPVREAVESFKWPGSLPAHRYIPDWKERNLYFNFERIPLKPAQEGRYVVTHGSYLIKCRQPQE